LSIISNAMKQYEMFTEADYTIPLESKRQHSPPHAKSQNSAEGSKLNSVECSSISKEDSILRTGLTDHDEIRTTNDNGERLISELLADYYPLQTSPGDSIHRKMSNFKPQNDPRKSLPSKINSQNRSSNNNTERLSSAPRTRNSEFSFEMTYFKPIEDYKLDEYIQSVNGSRGQTTTTSMVTSPEASPQKYVPASIDNYKDLEKTLNYWQGLCKDLNKSPTTKPQPKMKMGAQNPVIELKPNKSPTRSVSNQKPRPPPAIRTSTNTVSTAKELVRQSLSNPKTLSPYGKSRPMVTENKSPLSRKNSRDRSTSIESKRVPTSVTINLNNKSASTTKRTPSNLKKREEEQTYFKLDKLLQTIKTNNNTGTTKDNSRVTSESTSEIGLFQQNSFRQKDIVYVNLTPAKRVFGKNLISSGTNR